MKALTNFCIIFFCVMGIQKMYAAEMQSFSLLRQNGTVLEGYFLPPSTLSSPIVFALQGSSCESAFSWHTELCKQMESLGLGVIVLEKQGISRENINLLEYNQTNCLQNRLQDYVFCLEHMDVINPGWKGKIVFWGDSEGGMLAANLASQIQDTAAVLLFASGGGMKPREEVKWEIRHRLEEQKMLQSEIDDYMIFLDEQMDAMMIDPTPNKEFLGNTYKWWASLLNAGEIVKSLNQKSLPIFLTHGVEDNKIPISSADLAAEVLKDLTYFRLQGYGHDLDSAEVHEAACRWLAAVLSSRELFDGNLIVQVVNSAPALSGNAVGMSDYVFTRGRDKDNGDRGRGKGEAYVEGGTRRDTNGNRDSWLGGGVNYHSDHGIDYNLKGGGSSRTDRNGNSEGEVHVEGRMSTDF